MNLPHESGRQIQARDIFSPPFVVAVSLLVTAAGVTGPAASWLHLKQVKRPLPLKAPLDTLREEAIAPYRVKERNVLEPSVVEALDTEVYLDWRLEDSSLPVSDPLRAASLLVTYYTGTRSIVPHTPDVCYLGGGYTPTQPHENKDIEVDFGAGRPSKVPIRVCTFGRTAVFDNRQLSVVYTFHCNGRFVATRTGVRVLLNDPRYTYAYFSKIEVSFPSATRAQAVEGAQRLFNTVLPVLLRDHLPDFEGQEEEARRSAPVGD